MGWLSALGLAHLLERPSSGHARIYWIPERSGAILRVPDGIGDPAALSLLVARELAAAAPAFRAIDGGLLQTFAAFQQGALRASLVEPPYGAVHRSDWLSALVQMRAADEGALALTPWDMATGAGRGNIERAIAKAFALLDPARVRDAVLGPWRGEDKGVSLRLEAPREECLRIERSESGSLRYGMAALTALAAVGISRLPATSHAGYATWTTVAPGWQPVITNRVTRQLRWPLPGAPVTAASLRALALQRWWPSPAIGDSDDDIRASAERSQVAALWAAAVVLHGRYSYRSFDAPHAVYSAERNPLRSLHLLTEGGITQAAAERFRCADRSVRRWIASGDVPDEVEAWALSELSLF